MLSFARLTRFDLQFQSSGLLRRISQQNLSQHVYDMRPCGQDVKGYFWVCIVPSLRPEALVRGALVVRGAVTQGQGQMMHVKGYPQ